MPAKTMTTGQSILRAMTPSATSVFGCLFGAVIFVGLHMLMVSLHYGTILPNLFNGELSITYTNYVVGPILRFINLGASGTIFNAIIWGLFGWFLVLFLHFITRSINEWRRSETDIRVNRDYVIINHPLRNSFLQRSAWRLLIVLVFIAFLMISQPIMHDLLLLDEKLINGIATTAPLTDVLKSVLGWALFGYICVVLLRLYTFRTRLFSEILY